MDMYTDDLAGKHHAEIAQRMRKGEVCVYPTDTIYGIGCDATNEAAVAKIRALKQRPDSPFSVIAPSMEWIYENCEVSEAAKEYLAWLPGGYTFIFKVKKGAIAANVNPAGDTVGVRIPNHWFTNLVREAGIPFVTTSVNVTMTPHITQLDDLTDVFKEGVDFAINGGILVAHASRLFDLTGSPTEILRNKK